MQYTVDLTAERARALTESLDAMLWFQNERYYHHLRARMPWRGTLRRVGLGLSLGGGLLALLGAVFAPHLRLSFLAALVAFTGFVLVFWRGEAIEQAMRRGTRRLVARRARRAMAPLIRSAPIRIAYTLEPDRLRIHASPPAMAATLPLQRVRLAITGPGLMGLFARPYGQRPLGVLYDAEPAQLQLVQDALLARHAEVIALT